MRPAARSALLMALLLGVALGVRLAAAAWWEARLPAGMRFGFGDSESYWILAERLANGQPYQFGENGPRVFRTPGYPLLLAPLFWLFGGDPPTMAARVLGAVLGTAAVAGVAVLAWILFDGRAAFLAGVLAAFYPGAVSMSVFLLSEAPFCPLMLLQLIAWTKAWKADAAREAILWALAAGVAAGAATLMRPSWLLFTPFAIVLSVAFSPKVTAALWAPFARTPFRRDVLTREDAKQGSVPAIFLGGVVLGGLVLTMLPWWVRNYEVTGRFVATTLQVGASLYDGLSPHATGASDMRHGDERQREFLASFPADRRPTVAEAEVEIDQHLREAAIAWARQHPTAALRLAGVKFLRMWNVWPNAQEFQSWKLRLLVAAGYAPLLALGLWGAWRFGPRGWPYVLCMLPAVYFTALHVVFVASIRYRQPAMLALLVLAAGALTTRRRG